MVNPFDKRARKKSDRFVVANESPERHDTQLMTAISPEKGAANHDLETPRVVAPAKQSSLD